MASNTGGASYKTGIVVEARPGFARVQFPDLDGLVTDWLPTSHASTIGNRDVRTLDVGNHVGCILDDRFEAGQIIGAIYSEADASPATDPAIVHHDFGAGASFEFDRSAGMLTVTMGGFTLKVSSAGLELSGAGIKVTGADVTADDISLKQHPHPDPQGGAVGAPLPS
jgi:phage baseplate assembly protein gpV